MKIRLKIDRAGFATVFRTLAALLIGNGIVVPVLTDGRSHYWWVLLLVGLFFMMVTNIKVERGQTLPASLLQSPSWWPSVFGSAT